MSALGIFLKNMSALADDLTGLVKVSAKNTITVVGDDIATGGNNFATLQNSRELPVVLKVAKGAVINKLILVPIILGLSYFMPWIIPYVLTVASFYLAFEGFESFMEMFFHKVEEIDEQAESEEEKVKESVKIDFILSLEIILITLASVEGYDFIKQALVVTIVSIGMVFVIYGTVLAIIKIDDLGFFFMKQSEKMGGFMSKALKKAGRYLISFMQIVLKTLPYIGLLAVLYVGGEIFAENFLHKILHLEIEIPHIMLPIMEIAIGFVVYIIALIIKKIIKR